MSYSLYLKTFRTQNTYVDDWLDITNYMLPGIGTVKTGVDAKSFDIGNRLLPSLGIALNNRSGKFNDVNMVNTIFNLKRNNSLIKLDFTKDSQTTTAFTGLLKDDTFELSSRTSQANFTAVGRESILEGVAITGGSILSGQSIKTAMFNILNRTEVLGLLTVSLSNINPTNGDVVLDSATWFDNKSALDGINELLLVSDSIMVIESDSIIIKPRTETDEPQFYFYGQGIPGRVENIVSVERFNNGRHRVFNDWLWGSNQQTNSLSISLYGRRLGEITSDFITDTTKRDTLLTQLLTEFRFPKRELEVSVPISHTGLALDIMDKAIVNYQKSFAASPGSILPICGHAICGSAVLPYTDGAFEVGPDIGYKILGYHINARNDILTFRLREKGTTQQDGAVYQTGSAVCGVAICGEAICGQT